MFQPMPKPTNSPWGAIEYGEQILPGIWSVSTASHGGFILSAERMAAMPEALKCNTYGKGNCFEEDAEWALVAAAFKDEFAAAKPQMMQYILPSLKFSPCYAQAAAFIKENA